MYNIKIDENFKKLCITFRGAMILAKIKNTESSEALWEEIKQEILKIKYQKKLYQVDLNYLIT